MVSFELGKEIEKDVFFRLVRTWDKEKILSPHEESNFRDSTVSKVYYEIHMSSDGMSKSCSW